jgi:hypothetical protein
MLKQGGLKPWYLEECSSTLATTYSSGTPGQDASIATVDQDARSAIKYLLNHTLIVIIHFFEVQLLLEVLMN